MPYRKPSYAELCWYIIRAKLKEVLRMPYRPKVPCRQPGCPELVEPGKLYCAKHLPLHPEVTRPASKRGYGSRWQKASKAYLQSHPLCVECVKLGRYTKATVRSEEQTSELQSHDRPYLVCRLLLEIGRAHV